MSIFIEVPASKHSLKMRKPVFGFGINDADYITHTMVDGKHLMCPAYQVWKEMLKRCYSAKFQEKYPTYLGCSVTKEWLTFSNFREWMKSQNWEGNQLDKDILIPENKEYGPDSCIFVSSQINTLLTDNAANRGEFPQGVSFNKGSGKYKAYCNVNGNQKHLGYFTSVPEAELVYLIFKSELIKKMAGEEEANNNPKLKAGLLRHANIMMDKVNEHLKENIS